MIRRREKLISAAMLIALFLLARLAGAAVISYSPTEYTILAGGDLDVGIGDTDGSHIGGMVGAAGIVVFAADVIVSDVGGYSGSVFADDDVTIGDSFYITGRLDAGGESAPPPNGDVEVGNYPHTASLYAAAVLVVLTNADVGVSGNVQHSVKLTNNGTLHLDYTADGRLAPGTYRDLTPR